VAPAFSDSSLLRLQRAGAHSAALLLGIIQGGWGFYWLELQGEYTIYYAKYLK